jgi:hypothetical protein
MEVKQREALCLVKIEEKSIVEDKSGDSPNNLINFPDSLQ